MQVYKLGKQPARFDHRTLRLARYVSKLPQPPLEPSWVTHVNNWPMYMNDQIGDCAIAGAAHCDEQWLQYANPGGASPGVVMLNDNQVLKAYMDISGYTPGDPSTDTGCVLLDVLKYWRKRGIGGHKIDAFVSVNPKNLQEVAQAIWLFGNVYVGLMLPLAAQGADAWTVSDGGVHTEQGAPGSWGGHCVMVPAMSPKTLTCITWGERLKMSHNFWLDYVDECYVALSQEWMEKNESAPSGFDFVTLANDLEAL